MTNHRFYIYSNYDFLLKSAGTTRMRYYARALAGEKHKVYLVSCCSTPLTDEAFIEIEPNIFVLQKKKMTLNMFLTFRFIRRLNAFSETKEGGKTFIYYPSTIIFLDIWGLLYLRLYKRRSVFSELNEIPKHSSAVHAPLSFSKIEYSIKKVLFVIVFNIVEPLLSFYDGLICISTAMEKYAKKFNKNTLRIPILTDPDMVLEKTDGVYSTKGSFNIGFSGSIHPTKENLESFMDVISKIKKEGHLVSFNLCGSIANSYKSEFHDVHNAKEELNYYGFLNENELSAFLDQQDLLVVPRGFSLQNKYGFSTKLSDYLNHQKIVLLTDISDNKLYIKDGVNGFIVPPNDEETMYQKIIHIIENFEEIKEKVLPNAADTSRKEFHYLLFRDPLRNFLIKKSKQ
ncbi:MAG: glycosyltransferase family 4 protein [Aurantibacter sp.]